MFAGHVAAPLSAAEMADQLATATDLKRCIAPGGLHVHVHVDEIKVIRRNTPQICSKLSLLLNKSMVGKVCTKKRTELMALNISQSLYLPSVYTNYTVKSLNI